MARSDDADGPMSTEDLDEIFELLPPGSEAEMRMAEYLGLALLKREIRTDILFIDGTLGSFNIHHYRIDNLRHGLRELGYRTLAVNPAKLNNKQISRIGARIVVFVRAPYNSRFAKLVEHFRRDDTLIVYDVDDLVFDPAIIDRIDGVRLIPESRREGYASGVNLYRSFIDHADRVTVPTAYLKSYLGKLGCTTTAAIVPNSIGPAALRNIGPVEASGDAKDDFVIGYYSGTATHQRDFAVCLPGLIRFLRRYPQTRLRAVGQLDLNEYIDLEPLADRIERVEAMDHDAMLRDIASCHVVLAPLEIGNPYCESKSELKFFEAALSAVPAICSATETFVEATNNGQFGLLARCSDDWFDHLEQLYLSPSYRRRIGTAAKNHVSVVYSYDMAAIAARNLYFAGGKQEALEKSGGGSIAAGIRRLAGRMLPVAASRNAKSASQTFPYDIGVIMPGAEGGSGGRRNILSFCRDWAKDGAGITLYVKSRLTAEQIRLDLERDYFPLAMDIEVFNGFFGAHDFLVCTHWQTALDSRRFSHPDRVFYFVQDFEPTFLPVGSDYLACMETYRLGYHIVCRGKWVAERVRRELGRDVHPLEIPCDTIHYRPLELEKPIDVLFYARSNQHRRCFDLGTAALRMAKKQNPSLKIGFFGQAEYPNVGFKYENFGQILALDQLSRLYNRSRLGICFSPTNPSSVGYEMLACKLPVLDIRVPGYEVNFGGEDFVWYADPTPESVSSRIFDALSDHEALVRSAERGHDFVHAMPTEQDVSNAFKAVVHSQIELCAETDRLKPAVRPTRRVHP